MILLLDLGNTALKWSVSHKHGLSQHGWIEHSDLRVTELEALWKALPRPDCVAIASVGSSSAYEQIEGLVYKLWKTDLLRVQTCAEHGGVRNAYPACNDLGVDRWAAMIAARDMLTAAFCVIDCGTAITIDMVAADGQHQGGVIFPGLAMMQDSLLSKTHLPVDKVAKIGRLAMADNTSDAVANGACYACVAAIDRILQEYVQGTDEEVSCVITGGDSDRIRSLLQKTCLHDPDLVLKGMEVILRGMQ
ncbi:MAG TPA: type III pantothenate kinase [Gammaproteobacteria bacterium]|nr:type III pantothenate kinase [Gammaproteobacteria bacterium]